MLDFFDKSPDDKSSRRAENYFWKAMELLNEDKHDLAIKELLSAIKIDSETALELLEEQFKDYYDEGRTLESLTMGKVLMKHRPNNYQLVNRMGNIHRKLGERKQANELYKRAISIEKRDDTALYNLAASMAGVPRYDETIKKLLKHYIRYNVYLVPKSTYPKDASIINHLTEMLNMKQFFGKVERLQELILKKTLQQEEPDLEKMNILVDRIKDKINAQIQTEVERPNVIRLLREAMKLDWSNVPAGDKDRFLWDVLNLGLFIFKRNTLLDENHQIKLDPAFQTKDLDLAIDSFFRLKAEQFSYRYLDMIIALSHTLTGNNRQTIDELKILVKNDPNDRYINVNLGLLYYQEGNKLLSLVHLIKGAHILNELGGVYHFSDIIDKANDYYRADELKKALKLYQVAALETDSVEILGKIGNILISLHRYSEATGPYKAILRLDPESQTAKDKLKEIQDHFCFLADEFFNVREFIKASEHYEKALEISRSPVILKKAAKAYKLQGDLNKEYNLEQEFRDIEAQNKEANVEDRRKELIAAGLKHMKSEEFQKAIEQFKEAFKIRMDKDVFMYLSYLYKKFNHKKALQQLIAQWNAMMPKEEED